MTFFGPVLQISLVIKVIECHQSQHFYTLAKHIQKGSTTSNFGFPRQSLAVIFIFTSIRAAINTHGIRLPGETLSGAQLLLMSSKGLPHDWDSILLSSPPNSSSKWSNTGKNSKNQVKSVISYNFFFLNKLLKKIRHADHACVAVSSP